MPFFAIGSGPEETQVGVVTFSDEVNVRVNLSSFSNASAINAAVAQIPYTGGATYTSEGLRAVRTQLMAPGRGLRPLSEGVNRVLIVLTDGASTAGSVFLSPPTLLRLRFPQTFFLLQIFSWR